MDNIVEYMCKQLDRGYSDENLFCTKEAGGNCIGISGHALNYLLCGFLYHNKPHKSQNCCYRIKWVCEHEKLFPIVVCRSGQDEGQYIGTKATEPGLFDYARIGRQLCYKVAQEPLYLEVEQTSTDSLNKQIRSLEASIHDDYIAIKPKTQQCRKVLLSLAKETKSNADEKVMCSAQNCLLMFFAYDETVTSLSQYLQSEQDMQKCHVVLSFLASYCTFVMGFLPLYQKDALTPEYFRRHFFEAWKIGLGSCLANSVIRQDDGTPSSADSTIPMTSFLSVSEFEDLISSCIRAASYKQRTRLMKRLWQTLGERCDKGDAEVQMQLNKMDQYIAQMRALWPKVYHAS